MAKDEDLDKYIASQYNLMDHLTRSMYGPDTRFDQLSPFGQKHIESLARLSPVSMSPDPELQQEREKNALLREENANLMERIASLLMDIEQLAEEIDWSEDES